jgi:hypothetical protein
VQCPRKPYTLAGFEPTISCSLGGDDDHYTATPGQEGIFTISLPQTMAVIIHTTCSTVDNISPNCESIHVTWSTVAKSAWILSRASWFLPRWCGISASRILRSICKLLSYFSVGTYVCTYASQCKKSLLLVRGKRHSSVFCFQHKIKALQKSMCDSWGRFIISPLGANFDLRPRGEVSLLEWWSSVRPSIRIKSIVCSPLAP